MLLAQASDDDNKFTLPFGLLALSLLQDSGITKGTMNMKTLFKIAALCAGLFIAAPSFSQVDLNLQFGHRYHHRVFYQGGTYRHDMYNRYNMYNGYGGTTYRHEYGPGYVRHTRWS